MLVEPKMLLGAQRYYIAAIALFVIWSMLYFNGAYHHTAEVVTSERVTRGHNETLDPITPAGKRDELQAAIQSVFRTIKVDPQQRFFRDSKGKYFTGTQSNESTWTQPLGKRILIVDIDTRVPTGDNQILDLGAQIGAKIDWDTLSSSGTGLVSHAITNHYLYALIHGYEYRYYQALNMPDHYPTWIRPHIFKELLPDYDFVVAMDADVVVSHLEVPLEWMFNRWGIEKHTSMALPHDTEEFKDGKSISTDSKGVPVLNGGFIISHNNPTTFDMLEAWGNCTTEVRYPGCARWKNEWSHEQRAFSEYVRYDFGKVPGTIVGIPCDDAMGYPNFKKENEEKGNKGISDCSGNFVRHYTLGKEQVHTGGTATIAQALAEVLQKSLLSQQDEIIIKEQEPTVVAWEDQYKSKQAWETDLDDEDEDEDFEGPFGAHLRNSTLAEEEEEEEDVSILLGSKVSK